MKKLLFLLLFIPLVSLGQLKYKDIMKLDSKDAFEKLMFDKQFSITDQKDNYNSLHYALNPTYKDGEVYSTHFAQYTPSIDSWFFTLIRRGTSTNLYSGVVTDAGIMANDYDGILKKVKRKCEFVKMYTLSATYACYTCKDAEFDGYIAFSIIDGQGAITTFKSLD